ncbi:MAG: helix-turn-helix domain-containing protein [Erysipelotrichaceae bacterium]|nr:helix-turn-helix domain-containing protein [Erysipelotrichaceae bacterium]
MPKAKVDKTILINMFKQNLSISQIASVFNVKQATIYNNLRKLNVKEYTKQYRPYKKLNENDISKIENLKSKGLSIRQIAVEMNVNYSTIFRRINSNKIANKLPRNSLDIKLIEQIIDLKSQGLKLKDIAERVGCSVQTVIKYVHINNKNKKED